MKKALLITLAIVVSLTSVALADTVVVTSVLTVDSDANDATVAESSSVVAFTPTTWTITVTVAGQQCTLALSAAGSVPEGCNYMLTVGEDGRISGQLLAGNEVHAEQRYSCKLHPDANLAMTDSVGSF